MSGSTILFFHFSNEDKGFTATIVRKSPKLSDFEKSLSLYHFRVPTTRHSEPTNTLATISSAIYDGLRQRDQSLCGDTP